MTIQVPSRRVTALQPPSDRVMLVQKLTFGRGQSDGRRAAQSIGSPTNCSGCVLPSARASSSAMIAVERLETAARRLSALPVS